MTTQSYAPDSSITRRVVAETTDGRKSWRPVERGKFVNKMGLVKTGNGFVGYAIGVDVHKLDTRKK